MKLSERKNAWIAVIVLAISVAAAAWTAHPYEHITFLNQNVSRGSKQFAKELYDQWSEIVQEIIISEDRYKEYTFVTFLTYGVLTEDEQEQILGQISKHMNALLSSAGTSYKNCWKVCFCYRQQAYAAYVSYLGSDSKSIQSYHKWKSFLDDDADLNLEKIKAIMD